MAKSANRADAERCFDHHWVRMLPSPRLCITLTSDECHGVHVMTCARWAYRRNKRVCRARSRQPCSSFSHRLGSPSSGVCTSRLFLRYQTRTKRRIAPDRKTLLIVLGTNLCMLANSRSLSALNDSLQARFGQATNMLVYLLLTTGAVFR